MRQKVLRQRRRCRAEICRVSLRGFYHIKRPTAGVRARKPPFEIVGLARFRSPLRMMLATNDGFPTFPTCLPLLCDWYFGCIHISLAHRVDVTVSPIDWNPNIAFPVCDRHEELLM